MSFRFTNRARKRQRVARSGTPPQSIPQLTGAFDLAGKVLVILDEKIVCPLVKVREQRCSHRGGGIKGK